MSRSERSRGKRQTPGPSGKKRVYLNKLYAKYLSQGRCAKGTRDVAAVSTGKRDFLPSAPLKWRAYNQSRAKPMALATTTTHH